jgi:hypothetical protein
MNETDRELLQFAAKAAGLRVVWPNEAVLPDGSSIRWNPLINDGDALRLAVKLGILICQSAYKPGENAWGFVSIAWYGQKVELESEKFTDDPYAATRRAIVRAAAEIGRTMK